MIHFILPWLSLDLWIRFINSCTCTLMIGLHFIVENFSSTTYNSLSHCASTSTLSLWLSSFLTQNFLGFMHWFLIVYDYILTTFRVLGHFSIGGIRFFVTAIRSKKTDFLCCWFLKAQEIWMMIIARMRLRLIRGILIRLVRVSYSVDSWFLWRDTLRGRLLSRRITLLHCSNSECCL